MFFELREEDGIVSIDLRDVHGTLQGQIVAVETFRSQMRAHCEDAFLEVRRLTNSKGTGMYRVLLSELNEEYRNKGYGKKMYLELAAYAKKCHDTVIAADRCFGGSTSADAAKLWKYLEVPGKTIVRGFVLGVIDK